MRWACSLLINQLSSWNIHTKNTCLLDLRERFAVLNLIQIDRWHELIAKTLDFSHEFCGERRGEREREREREREKGEGERLVSRLPYKMNEIEV